MYKSRSINVFYIFFILFCGVTTSVFANNLTISNVRIGSRDPSSKTVTVLLDVTWDNSWRNKINHDAAWLTVRLSNSAEAMGTKILCPLSSAGTTPIGYSAGTNTNAEVYVPTDKIGFYVRPVGHQAVSSFVSKNVKVIVNYGNAGFTDETNISVVVTGMEMVLVPQGSFFAGDFATSQASLRQGSADTDPWSIVSNNPISVTSAASDGFYYVSGSNPGEFPTGASFVIPQAFPKGFNSFYIMKYEITEGQWVDFINSLPANARIARDVTNSSHKNSDTVVDRNTISCSGSTLICSTARPSRPVTYLNWKDISAFLDWAGLRPITELEYEKTARGPYVSLSGEYAWGTNAIEPALQINAVPEEGAEIIITSGANANFGDHLFSGGDSSSGVEYQRGPLRAGVFSTPTSTREASGAGNYGVMDLSGNVKEWVVTIGNASGLAFTGLNGNGYLTTTSGYEGNADVTGWVGMDLVAIRGVTSSAGSGFRGGSWKDSASFLQISDRSEAALGASDAEATYGGRGARSVDLQ